MLESICARRNVPQVLPDTAMPGPRPAHTLLLLRLVHRRFAFEVLRSSAGALVPAATILLHAARNGMMSHEQLFKMLVFCTCAMLRGVVVPGPAGTATVGRDVALSASLAA